MRTLVFVITFLTSRLLATAGDPIPKLMLAFSLTATNTSFSNQLSSSLVMRAERDAFGWEVGVFRRHSTDSLLYPQRNWHGAFPCQLSAWSFSTQTFPDDRVIPIRGHKSSIRIRLINATVGGESVNEMFTGGRAEIYWKHDG